MALWVTDLCIVSHTEEALAVLWEEWATSTGREVLEKTGESKPSGAPT